MSSVSLFFQILNTAAGWKEQVSIQSREITVDGFLGHDLRQCGAYAGAEFDLAGIDRHQRVMAVGERGAAAARFIGIDPAAFAEQQCRAVRRHDRGAAVARQAA